MWINSPKQHTEKRETSKWLPIIKHRVLWKCVILVKEKASWKYWLLWWWIERHEWKEDALRRELREEIGNNYVIEKMKELVMIETRTQMHNVFALKIWWNFHPASNEISWFAFYPLEDKFHEERKAIRKNMENYAVKAVTEFKHNHDWRSYEVSAPRIEWKYFDQFHKELDDLKKQILKKN